MVVDQMRADYLERYRDAFDGGLARLLDGGTVFRNAWVDHAYTNSLPGHTSAITGTYPGTHGIVDNAWHERSADGFRVRSGFHLVSRADGASYELGAKTLPERFLDAAPGARFLAVGANNASRLYAGQLRGPVFWLSADEGFVTRPEYAEDLPAFVQAFNAERLPELGAQDWVSTIPQSLSLRLRADDVVFENGGENTAFPHKAPTDESERLAHVYSTPFGDQATLELAAQGVAEYALGADDVPDIVAISLNALDENGHAYGPLSHEQTDTFLRLDDALGHFFDQLDELVGQERWSVALTADHGVAITPEQRRLSGSIEGRRISAAQAEEVVDAAYAAVANVSDPAARQRLAKAAVEKFDFIEDVYTEDEVATFKPASDTLQGLFALSYVPGRLPVHPFYFRDKPLAELGLYVVLKEDIMMDWATAIHGSQYDYDRRVPFLLYGAGVPHCERYDRVATVDIAPTLYSLAGFGEDVGFDGTDRKMACPV